MRKIVYILVLLIPSLLHAQQYNNLYKLGIQAIQFLDIYRSDSSVFCGGLTFSADTIHTQISLSEINYNGSVIRSKNFLLDSFLNYNVNLHSSIWIDNHLHYCVPSRATDIAYTCDVDIDSLTFKSDHYIADTSFFGFSILHSILLPSGNLMHMGYYQSPLGVYASYFVLKTDNAGNELWRHYYPFDQRLWQSPVSFIQLRSGNLLLGLEHGNYLSGPITSNTEFVEIDTLGTVVRSGEEHNNVTFAPANMVEMPNTDIIYATSWADSSWIDGSQFSQYVLQRGYIVRMDSAFHKIWELKIGSSIGVLPFYQLRQLSDGNFLAVGEAIDSAVMPGSYIWSGWLVKFSPQGQLIWEHKYHGLVDTTFYEINRLYDFIELSNGDIIACGEAQDLDPSLRTWAQQGWLLRVNSEGCLINGCDTVTGVEQIGVYTIKTKIYPNPSTDMAQLDIYTRDLSEPISFVVYDMLGQEISRQYIPLYQIQIPRHNLAAGVYTWQIQNAKGQVRANGKLVWE